MITHLRRKNVLTGHSRVPVEEDQAQKETARKFDQCPPLNYNLCTEILQIDDGINPILDKISHSLWNPLS